MQRRRQLEPSRTNENDMRMTTMLVLVLAPVLWSSYTNFFRRGRTIVNFFKAVAQLLKV